MSHRYTILRYQASLATTEPENFAVLVEEKQANRTLLFMVWRSPAPETAALDPLGKSISANLPEAIANLISDAATSGSPREDVLDRICRSMKWNYQATEPQDVREEDQIHRLAFKLFADSVAGADRLVASVDEASRRTLRIPKPTENLGVTFQAVLAVPERELSAAAD